VQFWPLTCYLDRSKETFGKLGSACMTPIMRVIGGTTEFLPVDRGSTAGSWDERHLPAQPRRDVAARSAR